MRELHDARGLIVACRVGPHLLAELTCSTAIDVEALEKQEYITLDRLIPFVPLFKFQRIAEGAGSKPCWKIRRCRGIPAWGSGLPRFAVDDILWISGSGTQSRRLCLIFCGNVPLLNAACGGQGMMRAIPGVKAKAGAKLVSTEKITRPDRRNSWRLSMAGEPDEDRLSLDAWSLIGLIAGGASVPLLIVVLARLFGHMPS